MDKYTIILTDNETGEVKAFNSLRDLLNALGYFGVKLWCADDICGVLNEEAQYDLGRSLTDKESLKISQMADDAADSFIKNGISCLEDCTDGEWVGLLDAAKETLGDKWLDKVREPEKAKKDKAR